MEKIICGIFSILTRATGTNILKNLLPHFCIVKEIYPERQVAFASDLQYALHYEGRDLTDDEAYRHLLSKYDIPEDYFYTKLSSEEYLEKAKYEFALCRQLQATSFPQVLIQIAEQKFYLLAKGYTDYETLKSRIEAVLSEVGNSEK